ncbi:MAG: hypothetical protein GY861_13370 [bacterium]|nr:hypothetical protein [bacterium]
MAFLYYNSWSNNVDLEREIVSVKTFLEEEKNQLISRDSIKAEEIKELNQNLINEKSARILLADEYERFKSVSSHVRFESVTKIDSVFIPFTTTDTLTKYSDCSGDLALNDGWMNFAGEVDSLGLHIDSLSFVNKFDVTIGKKKSDKPFAFLRKKEYTVELISYNPYTEINYVNNIVVDEGAKNKVFNSKPAFMVYGGVIGSILAWKLNK